ncbi:MAG TPA: hypothetical protein VF950_18055 [Planctomycetota bacterium]
MITFTCPSCQGKNQVGDEFAGRKMKCPKCGTRIRHHKDGPVEILTIGAPPPPSAAATEPAAPAVGAPAAEPLKESTAVLAAVADKLLSQGEGKQNTYIIWGVVGFLAVVLGGIGLMTGDKLLAVAPPAVALVAAFIWLFLRARKHAEIERIRQAAKHGTKDGEKTEPIPKA